MVQTMDIATRTSKIKPDSDIVYQVLICLNERRQDTAEESSELEEESNEESVVSSDSVTKETWYTACLFCGGCPGRHCCSASIGAGKGRYSKFSPIRVGLAANNLDGITEEMSELVEGLREVVASNRKCTPLEHVIEFN